MIRFTILTALSLTFILASRSHSFAQSKAPFDKDATITEAKAQLIAMASEAGELGKFCSKYEIRGEFVVDLTVEGKGDVLTVFMVSGNAENMRHQNALKDKLYTLRFENIKVPKKQKVKFRHTLKF
jgi:hypothetical protein